MKKISLVLASIGLLLVAGCSSTGSVPYSGYYPDKRHYDGREYPAGGQQPESYEVARLRQEVMQLRDMVTRLDQRLSAGERQDTEQQAILGDLRMALSSLEQRLGEKLRPQVADIDRTPDRITNPRIDLPASRAVTPLYRNATAENSTPQREVEAPPAYVDTSERQRLAAVQPKAATVTPASIRPPVSTPAPSLWNVVLVMDSKETALKVNRFLGEHNVKDRFVSHDSGRYLIYLGQFSQHDNAERRKNEIAQQTGLMPKILPHGAPPSAQSGRGV